MNPSPEFLERCAAETGFAPSTLEKVIRLGELRTDQAIDARALKDAAWAVVAPVVALTSVERRFLEGIHWPEIDEDLSVRGLPGNSGEVGLWPSLLPLNPRAATGDHGVHGVHVPGERLQAPLILATI